MVMNIAIMQALKAVVTEYAEGRGPLVKFAKQNEKIVAMAKKDPSLFRHLGAVKA
ncbi:hypothetical protein D3C87_820530 [compost metagenome]